MPPELRIGYFVHTVRSDWNNGNAHFLRGLLHELGMAGQNVTIFEPDHEWSIDNLREEALGRTVPPRPGERARTLAAHPT